jgi:hypothetical protein
MKCSLMPKRSFLPRSAAFLARRSELLGHLRRRLAPGQIHVDEVGGEILPGVRRAAEIERRPLLARQKVEAAILDAVIFAVEIDALAGHQAAPDGQEFMRLGIALVMRQEDAVAGEFGRIAADHDIEQQAAIAQPVECRGLARGESRQRHAGPQRHEEFQFFGERRKARRGDPGILAVLTGRQQHAGKAEPVDRLRDLLEVAEFGRPLLCPRSRDRSRRHASG